MNKLSKAGAFSPKTSNHDGPKLVSPQKIELNFNQPKVSHSQSQQNFTEKFKAVRNDLSDGFASPGLLNLDDHQRPETTNDGGNNLGNGILKSVDYSKRPATTADGYMSRKGMNKKPLRSEFKIKKMGSLYPTTKINDFMGYGNNNVETEALPETTKEDREAVEELERWDNEYKILAISKALESNQKKAKESQKHLNEETLETYKTPFLNREIINLIDAEEGYEGKPSSTLANLNKQKTRVPQKSLETIMTEYNKKILNDILFTRVSKKMNSKELNQKRADLDHATKSVSTDTVNNFKNLQHTIQTNPRIIEYDQLYQKLTIQKNLPERVFDFDEERKKLQAAENDYANIEAGLKVQFEAVINDIHKKKDFLNELRLSIHNNNIEIKQLEEEIEEASKKLEALEAQYNQQRELSRNLNRVNNRKQQRGAIREPSRSNAGIEEYSKLQRQIDEKRDHVNVLKEQIDSLFNENQKSSQKMINSEREIKDLKFKKNQLRLQLKQLYVKILKNEEHIFQHEASFITIIKNMWKINEEVLEDMFPSFVDKEALSFLIENARLEFELDQLENLSRSESAKEQRKSDAQYQEELQNRFLKTQHSLRVPLSEQLSGVKMKLQNLKKGIVKMKRPVFIKDGTARSRIIRWEELNLESDDMSEPHLTEQFIQEKINRAVASIRSKMADLKEKEINRIFNLYINKEIEEKNLKNLNKILLSLFGKQNAEKIYLKFIRVKQAHDFKVTQNKTFVFSSTKQFSNSILSDKTRNSYTLMLAYASNFRTNKTASTTLDQDKMNEDENKKEVMQRFAKQLESYNEADNLKINLHYNLNYNYAPELQNRQEANSKFYISKSSTPADPNRTKSSFKNLNATNTLSRVGTSSTGHRVTFNESRMPHIDMSLVPNAYQTHESRKQLRSAL